MKENTKKWLGDIFISQVNNQRAIDSAKKRPWWVAVAMFFLGTFLPVIPLMVSQGNTYGASFMDQNYTYGYDQALAETTLQLDSNGYRLEIKEGQLLAYHNEVKLENTWTLDSNGQAKDLTPIATTHTFKDGVRNETLHVYYSDRPYSTGENTVKGLIEYVSGIKYVNNVDSIAIYNDTDEFHKQFGAYTPSFLVLYKDGAYSAIYKSGSTAVAHSSYSGFNWNNNKETTNLIADILTVDGGYINEYKTKAYVEHINNSWKEVFNVCYADQKIVSFWSISGIFYGIFFLLNIFMGFMMWLLTRGKMNPNRGLKVYTCWWISGWTCVCPGLLAMIVGFIYAPAQQIAFIVLLGLRTMWLSMRQLNPRY